MAKAPQNIAASVRQRLLNLARGDGRDFQTVLVAFGLERLIYRLSISPYRDKFVLKGGMLVTLWTADPGRFTRDVDFLGFGEDAEASLTDIFTDILSIDAGDGLAFDVANLTATQIREDQIYGGIRLRTQAMIGTTQIPITIDLGFGDALTDPAFEIEYASLLDFEPATLRAYSPATVMAEKLQAIVALGLINGRMKDYYDLWAVPRAVEIGTDDLAAAIKATFVRRQTEIPLTCPSGLSEAFATDPVKLTQWKAYAEATSLEGVALADVVIEIWDRFEIVCAVARR